MIGINGIELKSVKSLNRDLRKEASNFVGNNRISLYNNVLFISSGKDISKKVLSVKINNNNHINVWDKNYACLAENLKKHYEEKFGALFYTQNNF